MEQLYELQIKASKSLLEKYHDYETNPRAERIEWTISRLNEQNSYYYFIQIENFHIGAIRIGDFGDLCMLKQIYILPEYQGHGYVQKAIFWWNHFIKAQVIGNWAQ